MSEHIRGLAGTSSRSGRGSSAAGASGGASPLGWRMMVRASSRARSAWVSG